MTGTPVGRQSPTELSSGVPVPREAAAMETESTAPPDWDRLIADARPRIRPPVIAQEFVGALTSASAPQKLRCDDDRLYAVKFRSNTHGDGRASSPSRSWGCWVSRSEHQYPKSRLST
jgi:hypothetical protein